MTRPVETDGTGGHVTAPVEAVEVALEQADRFDVDDLVTRSLGPHATGVLHVEAVTRDPDAAVVLIGQLRRNLGGGHLGAARPYRLLLLGGPDLLSDRQRDIVLRYLPPQED